MTKRKIGKAKSIPTRQHLTTKRYLQEGVEKPSRDREVFDRQLKDTVSVLIAMPTDTFLMLQAAVGIVSKRINDELGSSKPKKPKA